MRSTCTSSAIARPEIVENMTNDLGPHLLPRNMFGADIEIAIGNGGSWPIAEVTPLAVTAVKIDTLLNCGDRPQWARKRTVAVQQKCANSPI
jgi:hypothetical protein